jgi:hypothetical protein
MNSFQEFRDFYIKKYVDIPKFNTEVWYHSIVESDISRVFQVLKDWKEWEPVKSLLEENNETI